MRYDVPTIASRDRTRAVERGCHVRGSYAARAHGALIFAAPAHVLSVEAERDRFVQVEGGVDLGCFQQGAGSVTWAWVQAVRPGGVLCREGCRVSPADAGGGKMLLPWPVGVRDHQALGAGGPGRGDTG